MKTKTILTVAAALGIWWVIKRSANAASAAIDSAASRAGPAVSGLGRVVQLKRPIGANLASRMDTMNDTRGLGDFTDAGDKDFHRLNKADAIRPYSALPLVDQTRTAVRRAHPVRSYAEAMIRSTIPADPERDATTIPWWAPQERLNQATPNDPYHLQPLDRQGNVRNIGTTSPIITDRPGVVFTDEHGLVDEVAERQNYVEPGSPSYGTGTTTDYGSSDEQTYDPSPGALLNVR